MLVIDELSVRIAGRLLLEGASAQIPDGARIGLVGRNGAGKTTSVPRDRGRNRHRAWPRPDAGARAHRTAGTGSSRRPAIADGHRARCRRGARARCWRRPNARSDPHRIAEIQTRLADIGAHAAPARAAVDPGGPRLFARRSAARRARNSPAAGACASRSPPLLFAEPDILMLDEPTNFLDLEGTLWLQDHLARYPHTVIVISHDRDLLDNAVSSILHLDAGKLTFYRGDYSLLRAPASRTPGARSEDGQETGGAAQAPAGFCRALPRQGDQGAAGAVARQDAGKDAADRSSGRGRGAPDRVSASCENVVAADRCARRGRGRL